MDLIELVPNVSEGRSDARIDDILRAFGAGDGVFVLDRHRDESHNRSVLTAVARPEVAFEAALRLVERAVALIDLRHHRGEHPRIGAVDVLPLVPLRNFSRERTITLARQIAKAIASSFQLPVFLYADAALLEENRDLARLRRGGFEALEERMGSSELVPDYGPRHPHPTAGAIAVGVRDFLIAYNVELETYDRRSARAIARRLRASSGGLPELKALGFELRSRGRSQVSMNLTDFRVTSLETAFDAVMCEAKAMGVEVVRSEIVGLVPRAAAFDGMVERLKLDTAPGILEERMHEAGLC